MTILESCGLLCATKTYNVVRVVKRHRPTGAEGVDASGSKINSYETEGTKAVDVDVSVTESRVLVYSK